VNEAARREAVRQLHGRQCGYCSVRESEAGTELEIDHFQPRSAGGTDDLENLVYCCTRCNRRKGDFWPDGDPSTSTWRLLHPRRDDLTLHLREEADGLIIALTETGAFHLQRLGLNRPPLVALRLSRQEVAGLRDGLASARAAQARLQDRITMLEDTVIAVLEYVARLLGR
jgi:hypothetical protein